jgi:hypothetical protein
MGAWGPAIFSDDTAADTRDIFSDLVAEGLTATGATDRLIAESEEILADDDEGRVFWLALAATQWKLGRLVDSVRDRAIEIIDSGADLRRWKETPTTMLVQRRKHLTKLRSQLVSPPPNPKPLKRRVKSSTDLRPGDVASFPLDRQRRVLFCVLHVWGDRGGMYADICLLGPDSGEPFTKDALRLEDTLGPHFTMLSREPPDSLTMLRRRVPVPAQTPEAFRAWNSLAVNGHACTWDQLPAAVQSILPKLGWK